MKNIPLRRVLEVACELTGVSANELYSTSRSNVTKARCVTVGLCRELTNASFPEIGRAMGRDNHTSAFYQYRLWRKFPEAERRSYLIRARNIIGVPDAQMVEEKLTLDLARSVCIEAMAVLTQNGRAKPDIKHRVIVNLDAVIHGKYPPHVVGAHG